MKKRDKAAAAAITAVAAAGMVTGALFDSPADLLAEPGATVETVQQTDDEDTATETRQKRPAARLREWIMRLPAAVRMLVGVPLWALGWVLLTGFSALWGGAAVPLLVRALRWLCLTAVLAVVFVLTAKAAIPSLPVRKLLRGRNILFLLAATLTLAVADGVLPTVWSDYGLVELVVWRAGSACLLIFLCATVLKHHGKQPVPIAPPAPQRTEVEEAARRLADSVTPPR